MCIRTRHVIWNLNITTYFSLTKIAIALALTVLEVVMLMIIPGEGRSNEP